VKAQRREPLTGFSDIESNRPLNARNQVSAAGVCHSGELEHPPPIPIPSRVALVEKACGGIGEFVLVRRGFETLEEDAGVRTFPENKTVAAGRGGSSGERRGYQVAHAHFLPRPVTSVF